MSRIYKAISKTSTLAIIVVLIGTAILVTGLILSAHETAKLKAKVNTIMRRASIMLDITAARHTEIKERIDASELGMADFLIAHVHLTNSSDMLNRAKSRFAMLENELTKENPNYLGISIINFSIINACASAQIEHARISLILNNAKDSLACKKGN